jgi:hypothetical protein
MQEYLTFHADLNDRQGLALSVPMAYVEAERVA